jgi:hypothetical protein
MLGSTAEDYFSPGKSNRIHLNRFESNRIIRRRLYLVYGSTVELDTDARLFGDAVHAFK